MFSVLFEAQPRPGKWDDYLDNAKMLRPELERINGFVDNIRYKEPTARRMDSLAIELARRKVLGAMAHNTEPSFRSAEKPCQYS